MKFSEAIPSISNIQLLVLFLLSAVVWYLLFVIYNCYFCSIADIPAANVVARVSIWWKIWHALKGDTNVTVLELHKKHGPFVRLSHNEVSVHHPDAIQALLTAPLPKVRMILSYGIHGCGYQC
jgi:hypothetical protein